MDRLGRFLVFRPDWSSVTWAETLPSADALNRLGDLSARIVLVDGDSHLGPLTRCRLQRRLTAARLAIHRRHRASRLPAPLRLAPSRATLHRCVRLASPV